MAPFGISSRTSKRQGTYANQIQQGRVGGYHRGLNALTRLTPSTSGVGGPGFSSVSGTRGSGSTSGSRNNIPRNVPKPLQTSSLKKENGGQDVTAVLVNRRNGAGKKIGWGSALPPSPDPTPPPPASVSSEPTPAEIAESDKTNHNQAENQHDAKFSDQSPVHGPNEPNPLDKNIPWALHPPPEDAAKHPPNRGAYPDSYADEPFARAPRERSMNENDMGPPYDYPDDRYKNYRHNFRDRNPSHMHRGNTDYYERKQYEPFARKPSDDYSRDREIRPFARRPTEYNRGHSNYDSYNRDYNRDYDYRGGNEYRDYRDNRSTYNHRRPDSYQQRYHDARDSRGFSHDRDGPRRFSDRNENNQFARTNDYGHEFDRRHVPMHKEGYNHDAHNVRNEDTKHSPKDSLHTNDTNDVQKTENDTSTNIAAHHKSSGDINNQNNSSEGPNPVLDTRHQPPAKSEEDIIIQTIKERDAAEARKRAKQDLQTSGDIEIDDYNKVEVNSICMGKNHSDSDEKVKHLLSRNTNQVSGEASGNDMKLDQDQIDVVSGEDSDIYLEEEKEEKEYHLNEKSIGYTESRDTLDAPEEEECKTESNRDEEKAENDNTTQSTVQASKIDIIQDQEANLSESEKESLRRTRALKQQQKILEKVAAARENSKRSKKAILKVITDTTKQVSLKSTSDKKNLTLDKLESIEKHKQEKESVEAEAKLARLEYSKSRGPRTKGVLFRRLPNGSVVNADLTEEQIQKREARKLAKIKRIQEKTEKREQKRLQAKARKQEKKDNPASSESNVDTNDDEEKEVKKANNSKKKTFTPAPPPSVSAWKAGPPSGFKVQGATFDNVIETDASSDLDRSLFPDGVNGLPPSTKRAKKSRIDSYTKFTNDNETIPSSNALNQKNHTKQIEIEAPFSSSSALDVSVTQELATWNAFGNTTSSLGIPSLGLGQNNIMPASNWSVSQTYGSPSASAVVNIWSQELMPPNQAEDNGLHIVTSEDVHSPPSDYVDPSNDDLGMSKEIESEASSNSKKFSKNKPKKTGRQNLKARSDKKKNSKSFPTKRGKKIPAKVANLSMKKTKKVDSQGNDDEPIMNNEEKSLQDSKAPPKFKRPRNVKTNKKDPNHPKKVHNTKKKNEESPEAPAKPSWKKKSKRPIRRQKVSPLSEEKISTPES